MKYFFKIKNTNSGFMVVELLIAIFIIVISVLAFSNVSQKSINVSRQSLDTSQAAFLLEEGAEVVRLYRDINWSNISGMTVNTDYYIDFDTTNSAWYFTTTPNTIDKFTRKVVFQNVNRDNSTADIVTGGGTLDSGTKLVTITISWQDGTVTLTKNLSFYISDIFS